MRHRILNAFRRLVLARVLKTLSFREPGPGLAPEPVRGDAPELRDDWMFAAEPTMADGLSGCAAAMGGISDSLSRLHGLVGRISAMAPGLPEPYAPAPVLSGSWSDSDLFDGEPAAPREGLPVILAGDADFLFEDAPVPGHARQDFHAQRGLRLPMPEPFQASR